MSIERIGDARTGTGGQQLPFCQATVANGFVFVSGQVALGDDGEIVAGGVVAQTHHCIKSLIGILEKAGCTLKDVIKANVWLDDARDFDIECVADEVVGPTIGRQVRRRMRTCMMRQKVRWVQLASARVSNANTMDSRIDSQDQA